MHSLATEYQASDYIIKPDEQFIHDKLLIRIMKYLPFGEITHQTHNIYYPHSRNTLKNRPSLVINAVY